MSSAATPVVLPSRSSRLQSSCADLATTHDASGASEKLDTGQLVSPQLPQERETSANTCASLSHSHSTIEWSIARSHNKRKSSGDLDIVHGSQFEREKVLSEKRDPQNVSEKKAGQAFRADVQSELDRQEWKPQDTDRALYESSIQIRTQRREHHHANQLTDQSRRKKGW